MVASFIACTRWPSHSVSFYFFGRTKHLVEQRVRYRRTTRAHCRLVALVNVHQRRFVAAATKPAYAQLTPNIVCLLVKSHIIIVCHVITLYNSSGSSLKCPYHCETVVCDNIAICVRHLCLLQNLKLRRSVQVAQHHSTRSPFSVSNILCRRTAAATAPPQGIPRIIA